MKDSLHPDYWVFFTDAEHIHGKFCKKGFGHVFLIVRDDYNWMLINPGIDRLATTILDTDIEIDLPRQLCKRTSAKCIKVEVEPSKRKKFHISPFLNFPLLNCVSVIKYAIGVNLKGYTPYGFWKYLCRCKATRKLPNAIKGIYVLKGV